MPKKARKSRTPPAMLTRAGGKWTEARFITFLRTGLRRMSSRWPAKFEALKASRRPYVGDNKRRKFECQCSRCGEWFPMNEVEVEHIVECGKFTSLDEVQGFIERLFCETDGFRVSCKPCHKSFHDREREK